MCSHMDELLCFKVLLKFHGRGLLTQNQRKMLVFLNFTEERGEKNPRNCISFVFGPSSAESIKPGHQLGHADSNSP